MKVPIGFDAFSIGFDAFWNVTMKAAPSLVAAGLAQAEDIVTPHLGG